MRYVGRLGARQSSAGGITYVCYAPGTGLLRTCNALRIAGVPVLRNDGLLSVHRLKYTLKYTLKIHPQKTTGTR
ncbi:MAG: hypothetical protein LBM98_06075 [Oscillospiraceae bacterium]|nr:hypothetical protein [Oscillospiraceae bacterium]